MDTEGVWRLVEQARADTGGDDAEAVAARMTALLAQREPAEIVAFVQPLWDLLIASYRADLWAAAYMINGGASDDGFDYFRGWLLTRGRSRFERALVDPAGATEGASRFGGLECEAILSVPADANRRATGRELPLSTVAFPRSPAGKRRRW